MNVKTCTVCNEEKSLDQFYNKLNGKESKCKTCKSEYYKILSANPERKAKKAERAKARFHALSKEEQDIFRKRKQESKKRNPNYRAIKSCRRRLQKCLKGKTSTNTAELLGCSPSELRHHLESLWQEGMSWNNYGLYGWHIDHKRPVSSFDLSDEQQLKQCFHYSNLQPLWAKDNLVKSNKIM